MTQKKSKLPPIPPRKTPQDHLKSAMSFLTLAVRAAEEDRIEALQTGGRDGLNLKARAAEELGEIAGSALAKLERVLHNHNRPSVN